MRTIFLFFGMLIFFNVFSQSNAKNEIKMVSEYASKNPEIRDILQFEGIEYLKLKFSGTDLKNKSYHLTVKEIWDGKLISESTVFNSKEIGIEQFQVINDTVLSFKVIAKKTSKNKLKMTFRFPQFGITKEYDAIDSNDYSLRNIVEESKMKIDTNQKIYLLAYILPYEREDGTKSWCDVGTSGGDLEKWGEKFGIKHYLVFEMTFN